MQKNGQGHNEGTSWKKTGYSKQHYDFIVITAIKCLEDYNKDIFKNLNNYIAEAIIYYSNYLKQQTQEAELKSIEQILKQNREFFKEIVVEALNNVAVIKQEADIPKVNIEQEDGPSVIDDNFMSFYMDEEE